MTSLTTLADAEGVAARAATLLERLIGGAIQARGRAHVALAGGTTPARAYELLAPTSWRGVEFWFGDERCVPAGDPEANSTMVSEHLDAPGALVHRIEGELGPEAAAADYEQKLRVRLPDGKLDVALLGIGPDGHTASLFPGNPALAEEHAWCVAVRDAPKPPPERVSLSLPLICAARNIVLLASGASKADAVAAVIAGPDPHVPASLLRHGRLQLIVDDAASPPPQLPGR
ncbi:MAG: 6-phosphogluconolactonase [Solirubrobacteraceae bacterium]